VAQARPFLGAGSDWPHLRLIERNAHDAPTQRMPEFASSQSQSAHVDAIVEARRGKMRGSFSSGVITFKGIPYTAPPFGTNRLRPPRPPKSWSGVRDALAFGPKPPQVAYPPGIAERPARRPSTTAVGSPATASCA
jgi:hypothetical protein